MTKRRTLFGDVSQKNFKCRWERCWMGFRPSPFYAVRYLYLALEFACGRHSDERNHLRWDKVVLNLPGSRDFNPMYPWVMKWDNNINNMAGGLAIFIDDVRITGMSEKIAWAIGRQVFGRF